MNAMDQHDLIIIHDLWHVTLVLLQFHRPFYLFFVKGKIAGTNDHQQTIKISNYMPKNRDSVSNHLYCLYKTEVPECCAWLLQN